MKNGGMSLKLTDDPFESSSFLVFSSYLRIRSFGRDIYMRFLKNGRFSVSLSKSLFLVDFEAIFMYAIPYGLS